RTPRAKFPPPTPLRRCCYARHSFVLSTTLPPSRPPLPAALVRRAAGLFHCARRQRSGARLCLFRGRAGAEIGGGATGRPRIGALVFVCGAWRGAPLVGRGACGAPRKRPPPKKPL